MAEIYNAKGQFVRYEEKKISETFTVYRAYVNIDNSHNGKEKIEETPFDLFGKSMEVAKALKGGETVEIGFKIGGGKGFARITAISLKATSTSQAINDSDIQF